MMSLENKHVVVTGASSGLGRAVALETAGAGARLSLLARRIDQLEDVARQVVERGGQAHALPADVTVQDSVDAAITEAIQNFGPVDVLVANAGVSPTMSVHAIDVKQAEDVMRVNYFGVVYTMNAVLPAMIERNEGVVAAVSSLAASRGLPYSATYCASKAAVTAWVESLRIELRGTGVKLITSHPGYIRTPMTTEVEHELPHMVEVEDAARRLVKGICKQKSEINFPRRLSIPVKIARMLPNRIYDWWLTPKQEIAILVESPESRVQDRESRVESPPSTLDS